MRKYWFPKHYADEAQRLRVPIGLALAFALVLFADPVRGSLIEGIPFAVAGLAIRAWAAGHLAKNERLATSGPYAFVRNPLYVGTLIAAAGLLVSARLWWLAILYAVAFLLVYLPAIELEEQHLRNLFPEYEAYAEDVPLLIPRFPPIRSSGRFSRSHYWKNQEYNALAGVLAGVLWLAWKSGELSLLWRRFF